jgi:hypothetical protein
MPVGRIPLLPFRREVVYPGGLPGVPHDVFLQVVLPVADVAVSSGSLQPGFLPGQVGDLFLVGAYLLADAEQAGFARFVPEGIGGPIHVPSPTSRTLPLLRETAGGPPPRGKGAFRHRPGKESPKATFPRSAGDVTGDPGKAVDWFPVTYRPGRSPIPACSDHPARQSEEAYRTDAGSWSNLTRLPVNFPKTAPFFGAPAGGGVRKKAGNRLPAARLVCRCGHTGSVTGRMMER